MTARLWEPQGQRRRRTVQRAKGSAGPTWQAHAGVALPLVLADAVGRAGAGVAGARHAAASLHPQGMAGLGQHGPGDAVTQSHTLRHRGESHSAPVCLTHNPWTPLRGFQAAFPPLQLTDPLEREGSEQWTHLYAAPQPVLHLARAQDSPHVQMFHLQAVQFVPDNHRILHGKRDSRGPTATIPAAGVSCAARTW